MKTLLTLALIASMGTAFAEGNSYEQRRPEQREQVYHNMDRSHRPHPRAEWREGTGWVLPALIIGGLFGAAVANQQSTVIVEQPVPVYTAPTVMQPTYRYVQAYDESCPCWKRVLILNN
jgi:hypothetical protein